MKQIFKQLLFKAGVKLNRVDNTDYFSLHSFLYNYLKRNGNMVIVQIGANDGTTWDGLNQFIHRHHGQIGGIMVEPMRDAYEQLTATYARYPQIKTLNAAIHATEKEMTLYRTDPAKTLPAWAKGIASFDPDHHKRSGIASDCIITEQVRCISFDELVQRFGLTKIDLLQIDTEGYDAEIIRSINFRAIRPGIIRFEHYIEAGTMSRETLSEIISLLNSEGYQVIMERFDATAYLPMLGQ